MKHAKKKSDEAPIHLLLVDDSSTFRTVLKSIFDNDPSLFVIGEAVNGIDCLDLIIKLRPDVILMDMEMPLMDGMTALQHLMIHTPTPTIMFSGLTKFGTARSFDAIKNGAVDFVCKDSFFKGQITSSLKELMRKKICDASRLTVKSLEPVFPGSVSFPVGTTTLQKVVFCEDCGSREVVTFMNGRESAEVRCSQCGDYIDINAVSTYRRNNFVTFIVAGEGGYSNLLGIIPKLHAEMNGSVIIQIHDETDHVNSFTEYLNSISNMKVIRIQDGLIIEGGNCYVASHNENISLKPNSAHYTLRSSQIFEAGVSAIDAAMHSIAAVFKNRSACFILSGNDADGENGITALQKNSGSVFILDAQCCLCKEMGKNVLKKCKAEVIPDEIGIVKKIESLHFKAKETVLTA